MAIWYNLWQFGIVCGHLVYYSHFGTIGSRKIWQPCTKVIIGAYTNQCDQTKFKWRRHPLLAERETLVGLSAVHKKGVWPKKRNCPGKSQYLGAVVTLKKSDE
jgi:hypothetical protein